MGRRPGKYISVNRFKNPSNKQGVMFHEFGHILGFKHTNSSEGVFVECGYKYGHTIDPNNSIYRSFSSRNTPHSTDTRSIRHLWPDYFVTPVKNENVNITSNSWSRFKFKNPGNSYRPYTEIVLAHLKNGRWEPARFWCDAPDSSGNYDIWWYSPNAFTTGDHQFWVKGVSHAEEVHSSWSYMGYVRR